WLCAIWHKFGKDLISRDHTWDRRPIPADPRVHEKLSSVINLPRICRGLSVPWEGDSTMTSLDSFKCCKTLKVGTKTYAYYSLPAAEKNGLKGISRLPFSMKVLLENLLRNEDGRSVTKDDILAVAKWLKDRKSNREIAFRPARVLMQDFTGVPAVVDL